MKNDEMRLESARTFEELDKYAEPWDLLALNAPQQHPVLSHAWISAYLKTSIIAGESWFCLFAFDKNDLVGVLPLLVREFRVLWGKCLMLRTPNRPYSKWGDFIFKENYGKNVIKLFVCYLKSIRPRVIRLTINKVLYNSPTIGILEKGIYGINSSYYSDGSVSIINVEGNFDYYKRRLSKNFIRNLRKSRNSFKRLGNFSVTVVDKGKDTRNNLLKFARIEQSGWKGLKGSSIMDNGWRFFEELVNNMGNKEWLKWYFLETENKTIAGYLTITFGRRSYFLKTSYDETYRSHSPGSVLMEEMLEQIYATGEIDFINLFSDYEWFSNWNVERKPYYKLIISFNHPLSFFLTRVPFTFYSKFLLIRKLKRNLFRFLRTFLASQILSLTL